MNWNRNLPAGTNDKLFREAESAFQVEQQVNSFFQNRGFKRIETPIMEFEDVFRASSESAAAIYRFFDSEGRTIALRPDMTLPIGRVISTAAITLPVKLSYSGKVFRAHPELIGEQNEQTQAGIEIIGFSSLKAELECILSGITILSNLAIPNFQIELGHAVIYQEILKQLQLDDKTELIFRKLLLNKSISGIKTFVAENPSSLDDFILELPWLFGPAEEILQKAKQQTDNRGILAALSELGRTVQLVEQVEPDVSLSIDLGLIQDFDYYTGLIFRGYADHASEHFLSGGRYDLLLERFGGNPTPAVGLALHLDKIVRLKNKIGQHYRAKTPDSFVHYGLAQWKEAEHYLAAHPEAELSFFEIPEESIAYAKKWQIKRVILINEAGIAEIYREAK